MIYATEPDTQNLIKAEPHKKAICPDCSQEMIAKCGEFVIHHWAHKALGDCDSHWEPISQWHLEWQNTITNPIGGVNIEVPIVTTERYKRADMITHTGMIIEFQKTQMSKKERVIRESHYNHMLWVIHKDISNSKMWWPDYFGFPKNDFTPKFVDNCDGTLSYKKYGMLDIQFIISKTHFIKTFINNHFRSYSEDCVFDSVINTLKIRYNNLVWNNQAKQYLTPILFLQLETWETEIKEFVLLERILLAAKKEKEAQEKINKIRELARLKKEEDLTNQYRYNYPENLHKALQIIFKNDEDDITRPFSLELHMMSHRLSERLERERNGGKTNIEIKLEMWTRTPIVNIKPEVISITNINPNKIDVWDYKPSVEEIPLIEPQQKKVIKEMVYSEWFSLLRECLLAKGYVEVSM